MVPRVVKQRLMIIAEKAMAPHSSTLAWKIPWTEEPGRLQSMGSLTEKGKNDGNFRMQNRDGRPGKD